MSPPRSGGAWLLAALSAAPACGSRTTLLQGELGTAADSGAGGEAGDGAARDAACLPPGEVVLARGGALDAREGISAVVAVDDTTVYWTETSRGRVVSVPKCGGAVATLA